jgi:tetratricopeptide (TPR) repeat protein
MPRELLQLNVRNPALKILLLLLLLVAGAWSYYVVRWYIGNTVAEYFNPAEGNLDLARRAVSLAPNDPMTHWRIAQVSQRTLPLDQQEQAIVEYEKAVSLSPYDYRFWMTLGTAYEQAGDPAKGEQALKRAVALAPAYAYPHWYLGNLLLRNARYDEAFAELRLASAADQELQGQLFNLIWEVHSDDLEAVKKAIGPDSSARANFVLYLLEGRKRFEEGLRLWNGMSSEEKKANKDTGEKIVATLNRDYKFHDALHVWNDISADKYHAEIGRVFDGSFEEPVEYGSNIVFGWQVSTPPQMQIGIDPARSHDGSRSLRLVYQVRNDLNGVQVGQVVPVQPRSQYDFECYVSTDKLETGSSPQIQILDAVTNLELALSPMAPGGTSHWNRVNLSFSTSDKTEAVILKIMRNSCSNKETPVCPIFGSVWYDDFSIKRRN